MLRFVIGLVSDFKNAGISIQSERTSLDETRAIKHIELLTDLEFESIRFNQAFEIKSEDYIFDLLLTPEWALPDDDQVVI